MYIAVWVEEGGADGRFRRRGFFLTARSPVCVPSVKAQ